MKSNPWLTEDDAMAMMSKHVQNPRHNFGFPEKLTSKVVECVSKSKINELHLNYFREDS